jgi:hypothetical protein
MNPQTRSPLKIRTAGVVSPQELEAVRRYQRDSIRVIVNGSVPAAVNVETATRKVEVEDLMGLGSGERFTLVYESARNGAGKWVVHCYLRGYLVYCDRMETMRHFVSAMNAELVAGFGVIPMVDENPVAFEARRKRALVTQGIRRMAVDIQMRCSLSESLTELEGSKVLYPVNLM